MFSQKMMRVSMERGLNFDKVEVFFANKSVPIRSGLSVDLEIIRGVFVKNSERTSGARVDFRKLKGVFRKTTAARPI